MMTVHDKDVVVFRCGDACGLISAGKVRGVDEPILLGYSGLSDTYLKKYVEDSRDIWQGRVEMLDSTLICSVIGTHTGPVFEL